MVVKNCFLVVFIPVMIFLLFSCTEEDNHNNIRDKYILSDKEYGMIKEGDIIMRQGYGMVSSLILKILDEDISVSHIGVIAADDYDNLYVIHSVSQSISQYDGMQYVDLESFVDQSRPKSIIVSRYVANNPDKNIGKTISKRAKHYLDLEVPFDHSFNLEDTTAFYCSELVWRIFVDLFDDDIFDSNIAGNYLDKLKFEPFFSPDKFETIINHHKLD